MDELQSIYYQQSHMWKGQKAIRKLRELSKEKPNIDKQLLLIQAFWQVHSPFPKRVDRPHYEVMIPNEMHQFDLLYMPNNMLYMKKYKYILSRMDVSSRYKVTWPLRMKQAKVVSNIITDIYKVGPLTYPDVFQCNNGNEFKAEITKILEKHGVMILCAMMKYKHTHMRFIRALNKLLSEQLFKVQDVQELNNPEKSVIKISIRNHVI